MPDLYAPPIPLPEALTRLTELARVCEPPYQEAIAVVVREMGRLEDEGRVLRAKVQHWERAEK